MSGCCGPGPVITSLPPVPRVDVEGSLLCDVLADGTIAGQALVEAVYDTSSGLRVGTRPVDPVTGADYLVQGTLQPCPPPEQCSCETVLLCHTPPGTPIPGPTTSPLPLTATGQPTTHTISGAPRFGSEADATAIWAGQTVGVPGSAAGGSDAGAHTHYTVGLAPGTPDCGTLDPAGTVEITATVTYTNDGAGGAWDWYGRLSLWVEGDAAPVAADDFGQGSAAFFTAGETRTATITGIVSVAALQAGDVSVEFNLETGADPNDGTPEGSQPKTWTVTGATVTATAAVTGCTLGNELGNPTPFLRHICRTCAGNATVTDTELDGTTPRDTSTGTVGPCGQESTGRQVIERHGCDQTASGIVRYVELWSVDTGNPDDEPLLLGTWLDGDFTQPYEPVNPIDCPTEAACASPTTPVTSVGLCLADGTPIAVTVVRDCDGAITSEGWLNLTSGAWTAGAVPVGTVACGDSRSIQVSGTFCAVDDTTGDVSALVLVEYTYGDTGAIEDVRLVDAVTGTTYTPPAGVTVTTCPTGTEQPEQDAVVLCHTATDGTATQFVRDYRRDETGTITGHSDYLLDGTAYTPDPTGTVGVCQPGTCTDCETLLLCDVPTTAPVRITGTAASGTLSNGVSWTSTSPTNVTYAPQRNNADGSWWGMPSFPLAVTTPTKWTFDRPVFVEFSVYVAYHVSAPALSRAQLPAGLEPVSLPTGYAYDPATGVLTRTSDGDPADPCSYTTDPQVAGSARFRTTSAATTFTTAPAPNSRVARCGIFFTYWSGAVSVVPGGPFLRHICRSCDGTPTVTDTLLDGVSPYLPAGTVGQCQTGAASSTGSEACHNTTTVLLCAAPADDTTDVTPTITDSNVAAIGQTQFQNHPGPYTPLWTGGTLVYPAGPSPTQQHLAATGQFTADVAGCEDASGTLTVSVRVRNDGPDDGQAWDGALRLFRGTTQIAAHNALEWAPVGWQGTLTVSAPVTAAEVAAGDIRVSVQLETYHLGAKQWTADQFTASLTLEGCDLTTPVQILRNVVTDCETGEVVATYDTTLDGEPYDVGTGEVSQCQPVTQPQEPDCCPTSETVHLCHTVADGTVVTEFVRDYHRDATGIITGYSDYTLDGADFVADPAGTVGQCRPVDCTSTPLCVRPSGTVEFISNADNNTTGDVDPVWKWSLGSLAGPWYDMYQVGVFPGWTVTDPGTPGGTAHWVAQHPDRGVDNTGLPGEGPSMTAATPDWYARASFDLPPFADPATIQVASTVLNADQLAVEWRLNAGPWQSVNRDHNDAAYGFGPAAVPGAQAGTNTIYLHGRETVFGSGASGVMMHLVVTYDVDATAFEQWLRTTCSDGSITYLDGDGNPQAGVPADYTIVPCPGSTGGDGFDVETWPLCVLDSTGAVVQHVRAEQVYDTAGAATGAPRLVDAVTGDPATIPAGGSVTVCPSSTRAPVLTGARSTTGTAPVDLAAEFPGLQSVTLLVSSGSVLATLTDGTAVPIPAGANVTWSVTRDQDAALDAASFAGADAGTTFLLLWTYTA
ncbi:hypothetical protein ACFOWE_18225 [Planomonospora corallina]|uniref:Uncharacterized protein n=1 Tax=Planomonospora corallina TaxID=1806052 RepID=A0ABV8I8P1_9ACTN